MKKSECSYGGTKCLWFLGGKFTYSILSVSFHPVTFSSTYSTCQPVLAHKYSIGPFPRSPLTPSFTAIFFLMEMDEL